MFGITSAPEKYQKIANDVLQGCEDVANIIDQHDKLAEELEHLAVLDRLRQCGLT